MRKTLTASATALFVAVTSATPALADNNVNWFLENDNDYTVNMDAQVEPFTFYSDDLGSAFDSERRSNTSADGSGDKCAYYTTMPKTLVSNEHQYLCFFRIPSSKHSGVGTNHGGAAVKMSNFTVTSSDGKVFTLDGELNQYVNNPIFGKMDLSNESVSTKRGPGQRPDWLGARFEKSPDGDHYNLTYEMKWEAPKEQEAKLQSLMEVDTPDDCTITGTPGDDFLEGTEGDDVICGLGGDDYIDGKGGKDIIKGGAGDDTLAGGDGDDVMGGGPGDDVMDGGAGDDAMHGSTGEDVLTGGDGKDLLDGGSGEDIMDAQRSVAALASFSPNPIFGSFTPDPIFGSSVSANERKLRSATASARQYLRSQWENNASTDDTVAIVEDSDGDGVSAAGIGVISLLST